MTKAIYYAENLEELAGDVVMVLEGHSSMLTTSAAELRRLVTVEQELEDLKASNSKVECQYSKDIGMTDCRCAGKCQYEALARAVMSDNTGKA